MAGPRRSWPHIVGVFALGTLLAPVGAAIGSLMFTFAVTVATLNTTDWRSSLTPGFFLTGVVIGLPFALPVAAMGLPLVHVAGAGPSGLLGWGSALGFASPVVIAALLDDGLALSALLLSPVGAAAGAVCAWLFECAVSPAATQVT